MRGLYDTRAMTKTFGQWVCIPTSNHAHDYRLIKPDGSSLPVNGLLTNDHSEQRAIAKLLTSTPEMLDHLRYSYKTLNFVAGELLGQGKTDLIAYHDSRNLADAIAEILFKVIDE